MCTTEGSRPTAKEKIRCFGCAPRGKKERKPTAGCLWPWEKKAEGREGKHLFLSFANCVRRKLSPLYWLFVLNFSNVNFLTQAGCKFFVINEDYFWRATSQDVHRIWRVLLSSPLLCPILLGTAQLSSARTTMRNVPFSNQVRLERRSQSRKRRLTGWPKRQRILYWPSVLASLTLFLTHSDPQCT